MKEYDGRVRLVFKDMPLPFHDLARPAHEAARCAAEAGKFWAYHDRPARALRWRLFSVVVDWRLMREMEADGRAIPESKRSLVESRVARDGER